MERVLIFRTFLRILRTACFAVTGIFFINSSFAVNCNDGYRPSCLPNLDTMNKTRIARAAKPLDGSAGQTDGNVTAETYGLSSPGEWGASFETGIFIGESKCDNSNILDKSKGDMDCWCKAKTFIPSDTEGITCVSTTGPWTFRLRISPDDTPGGCQSMCALYCASSYYLFDSHLGMASADSGFYDSLVEYADDVCVPDTYKINYVLNGLHFPATVNVHTFYQITDADIPIPAPIVDRIGYEFDGWYETPDFSGNRVEKIPTGSFGNKTFYAKWSYKNCPEGYFLYETSLSDIDATLSPTGETTSDSPPTATTSFPYGAFTLTGIGISKQADTHANSYTEPTSDWLVTDAELTDRTPGTNCWCSILSFTPTGGAPETVSPKIWVANTRAYMPQNMNDCTVLCSHLLEDKNIRYALLGKICKPYTYDITYKDGELTHTDLTPRNYTTETAVTLPTLTKNTFVFKGWCEDLTNCDTPMTSIKKGSFGNKTLHAKWVCPQYYHQTENDICEPTVYTVKFKDGDNTISENNYTVTQTQINTTISPQLTRETGYIFEGWCNYDVQTDTYTNCDKEKAFQPSDEQNITFYAKGRCADNYHFNTNNICELTVYTVTFKNGDTILNEQTYTAESERAITSDTVDISENENFFFAGWCEYDVENNLYYNCASNVSVAPNTAQNKTFYIKWLDCLDSQNNVEIWKLENNIDYTLNDSSRTSAAYKKKKTFVSDDGSCDLTYMTNYGEWSNVFEYGKISGISMCTDSSGIVGQIGYPNSTKEFDPVNCQDTTSTTDVYCWCKMTGLTPANETVQRLASSARWVFRFSFNSGSGDCFSNCPSMCAAVAGTDASFRNTLLNNTTFGVCVTWYDIHYVSNGGTEYDDMGYNINSGTITLPTPTRPGYVFGGWYETPNFSGDSVSEFFASSLENKTFYAKWFNTITFVTNGGDKIPQLLYNSESDTITLPNNLVRENFRFDGWYENKFFTNGVIYEVPHGSTGNKTFYAKWTDLLAPNVECEAGYKLVQNLADIDSSYYKLVSTAPLCSVSNTVPDEQNHGDHCFCRITGLTTSDGVFHNTPVTPWVYIAAKGSCDTSCPDECRTRGRQNRSTIYQGELDSPACVLENYFVTYNLNGGKYLYGYGTSNSGSPVYSSNPFTFTYTKNSLAISQPPSVFREGYEFAGWCESESDANDQALASCPEKNALQPSDMVSKTFYAKWKIVSTSGCQPGYYSSQDSAECTICEENHYCIGGENSTMKSCPPGLVAPVGTVSADECGKIMRIGEKVLYLTQKRQTIPALAVKIDDNIYYAKTTPVSQIEQPTKHFLRTRIDGIEYSIHDNTIQRRN